MCNYIKIRENIKISDCDLELVNDKVIINNFCITSKRYGYRLKSDKILKDTYKLGELLDSSIMARFKQRQLEIRKKYFSDTFTLKQNVVDQLKELINLDIPKTKLSSFIPLYTSTYNLLNDKELDSPDNLMDFIIFSDEKSIRDAYDNLINKFISKDIDVTSIIEPLTKLIVLSNGTYSDIQANIILTDKIKLAIKAYCKEYGMPFWTDREQTNEIPIDNFIKICILIYRYKKLWNAIIDYDKIENEITDFKDMYFQLDLDKDLRDIAGDYITRNNALEVFLFNIVTTDANIRYNYCWINDVQLINYRIWNKPQEGSILILCETEYESLILAVWDYFYLNYLSNSKNDICANCGIIINGKFHKLRGDDAGTILCDKCYKTKRKEDIKNNVNNYRNKQEETN